MIGRFPRTVNRYVGFVDSVVDHVRTMHIGATLLWIVINHLW